MPQCGTRRWSCTLASMDHRLSVAPVLTALEQMAAMAKETHDAFIGVGFDRKTATDLTIGLLRQGN